MIASVVLADLVERRLLLVSVPYRRPFFASSGKPLAKEPPPYWMRPENMNMHVTTTRFGTVPIQENDILAFDQGLIGMESCRRWVLLADAGNSALAWLQSLDRPEVALAVVSPRRFVADYQVRVSSRDLAPLGSQSAKKLQVLAILNRHEESLTLNLKAPIVVNLETQRGRQIVAKNDHEVQYVLGATIPMRRSA